MTSDSDTRRKRLAFRCWHRGTREMDLMLGRFADRHLTNMDDDQLGQFEKLLENNDPDLYNWITGHETPPPDQDSATLHLLQNFKVTE